MGVGCHGKHFGYPNDATNKFWQKLVLKIFSFESVDNVWQQQIDKLLKIVQE